MPLKIKRYQPLDHVKPYETTHKVDYTPKVSCFDATQRKRDVLKHGGQIPEVLLYNEVYKYIDNFTSLNDLKYHLLPKCAPHRRKQPQDMLMNFGNLTKFGLLEQKRYDLAHDVEDPRSTLYSDYRNVYTGHDVAKIERTKSVHPKSECDVITWECKNSPTGILHYRCNPEQIPRIDYRLKYLHT